MIEKKLQLQLDSASYKDFGREISPHTSRNPLFLMAHNYYTLRCHYFHELNHPKHFGISKRIRIIVQKEIVEKLFVTQNVINYLGICIIKLFAARMMKFKKLSILLIQIQLEI